MFTNRKKVGYDAFRMVINEQRLDVSRLRYITFDTGAAGPYQKHCQSAYALWKQQWLETFGDLDRTKQLTSDDFLDRELCGLFNDDQAIGFMLCKFMDLRLSATIDTLYFKNYPQSLRERNQVLQDKIMIMSYMTLNPDWRKSKTNFSISELLIGFMILRLNISYSSRAIGYFRNNRSTQEIFYRHSGRFLLRDYAYNVDVDYAETDSKTSTLSTSSSHALLNLRLWNEFYNKKRRSYEFERSLTSRQGEPISRTVSQPTLDQ